jgi:hypothetical protein
MKPDLGGPLFIARGVADFMRRPCEELLSAPGLNGKHSPGAGGGPPVRAETMVVMSTPRDSINVNALLHPRHVDEPRVE